MHQHTSRAFEHFTIHVTLFPFLRQPGYYEDGAFGIRIESVLLTQKVGWHFGPTAALKQLILLISQHEPKYSFGGEYCSFENITWAPICRNLVDVSLLTDEELQWLNNYHAQTKEKVRCIFCSLLLSYPSSSFA